MKQMFILQGAPGSGKTSLINRLGVNHLTVSRDTLRDIFSPTVHSLDGETRYATIHTERDITDTFNRIVTNRLRMGSTIFIDGTHPSKKSQGRLVDEATKYGYTCYLVNMQQSHPPRRTHQPQPQPHNRTPSRREHHRRHLPKNRNRAEPPRPHSRHHRPKRPPGKRRSTRGRTVPRRQPNPHLLPRRHHPPSNHPRGLQPCHRIRRRPLLQRTTTHRTRRIRRNQQPQQPLHLRRRSLRPRPRPPRSVRNRRRTPR